VRCLFTADLHGHRGRYQALRKLIEKETPAGLFIGGDLFRADRVSEEFIKAELFEPIVRMRKESGKTIRCFIIMGNDDPRGLEETFQKADADGIIDYVHNRAVPFGDLFVTGYSFVPPTPFQLKDWEKYDVSRFVDPGCVSPEEGYRSVPVPAREIRYSTIADDLDRLAHNAPPNKTIYLFHSPPYKTCLDRAALDGKMIDFAPLDVHVGSIAIERFIRQHQPLLSLHGHIHESTRLTGQWSEKIGQTVACNGSCEGDQLAIVRFDPHNLGSLTREVISLCPRN